MKRYEKYKHSSVDWIGEIPEGWEVRKLKFYFTTGKGLTITKENLSNEGVFCLNYGEIHSKYPFKINPLENELKCVSVDYLTTNENSLVQKGDFVFADTSEDIEGSGNFSHLVSDVKLFAGYHTVIVRPKHQINSLFFAFLFESLTFRNQIRNTVKGVKVYSITQGILNNLFFWIPPLPEQTAIAAFLDDKTAKIDQTIAIRQKEIELLKERGQILIQKAVTKGLDDSVKLKPSGVDWIGEIPEHWEVRKLISVCRFVRGNSTFGKDELLTSGEYIAMQYGKTYKVNEVNEEFNFYVNNEFYKDSQVVNYGDIILVSTSETMEDLGHTVYYKRHDLGLIGGEQIMLKPKKEEINSHFLYFSSKVFTKELRKFATGIKVFRFNINNLKTILTVVPPLSEQLQIVSYLENIEAKISKAISIKEQEIEKLKEYKTVLIDSVVTGKVRVS